MFVYFRDMRNAHARETFSHVAYFLHRCRGVCGNKLRQVIVDVKNCLNFSTFCITEVWKFLADFGNFWQEMAGVDLILIVNR